MQHTASATAVIDAARGGDPAALRLVGALSTRRLVVERMFDVDSPPASLVSAGAQR